MAERVRRVLFLCTGNSARSILAEALLNHLGTGRFEARSAGSHPTGSVNPHALRVLGEMGVPAPNARSKSWDEFATPDAPTMDVVVTVCDSAAGEVCPFWPGRPMTAHWGVPDPAAVRGSEEDIRRAFRDAALVLKRRVELLLEVPFDTADPTAIQRRLRDIGHR